MTPPTYRDDDGNQIVLMNGCLYLDVAGEEAGSVALNPQLEAALRAALTIGDPQ
ncbi:hypothetical protein KGD82_16690 [Nocardiopsis eucommiae]|uniref:Uncharacterized protein n=1 Tax=Nocardiopsis eucommiae TaxID=2831970 RepID=A0A975QJK7_9ACTN|nr:hypothetical protein KGD82_16690 [Nocardiopsis eucommiae]